MVQAERCLNCHRAQQGPAKVTVEALGWLRMGSSAEPASICLRASPFLLGKEPGHGTVSREAPRAARKIGLEGKTAAGSFQGGPGSGGAPGSEKSGDKGSPGSGAQPRLGSAATCRRQPGPGEPRTLLCPSSKNRENKPFLSFQREALVLREQRICLKSSCPGQESRKLPPAWLHPRNTSQEHAGMFARCPQHSTG